MVKVGQDYLSPNALSFTAMELISKIKAFRFSTDGAFTDKKLFPNLLMPSGQFHPVIDNMVTMFIRTVTRPGYVAQMMIGTTGENLEDTLEAWNNNPAEIVSAWGIMSLPWPNRE